MENAKGLEDALRQMPEGVSRLAATTGVRKGAAIMKKALQQASPKSVNKTITNTDRTRTPPSGELKRSWRYKKLRKKHSTSVAYVVELKHRYYYDLLEFEGLEPGERKRAGSGARQWAPKRAGRYHPFAEKAIKDASQQGVAVIMAATKYALGVEAGKAYRRSQLKGRR